MSRDAIRHIRCDTSDDSIWQVDDLLSRLLPDYVTMDTSMTTYIPPNTRRCPDAALLLTNRRRRVPTSNKQCLVFAVISLSNPYNNHPHNAQIFSVPPPLPRLDFKSNPRRLMCNVRYIKWQLNVLLHFILNEFLWKRPFGLCGCSWFFDRTNTYKYKYKYILLLHSLPVINCSLWRWNDLKK